MSVMTANFETTVTDQKNCIDDYEAKSDGRKQEEFNSHYSSIGD